MGLPGGQWETLPRVKQFVLRSDVGQSSIFFIVKEKRTSCGDWFSLLTGTLLVYEAGACGATETTKR